MLLEEMISRLRVNLNDPDVAGKTYTKEELESSIQKAVSDLSRILPDEKMADITLKFAVTDEVFTSTTLDTWVSLANAQIKYQSETVTNAAGTVTYTRDTDFTMDYLNGKIKPLSSGTMAAATNYKINYDLLKIGCSISSIIDELMKVDLVEYPLGNIPQTPVSVKRWGSYLTILSGTGSQEQLSEGKHIGIYYQAVHTPPTSTAAGSYSRFLDHVIITGSEAYAMFLRVIKLIDSAKTLVTSASTDLTAAGAQLAATKPSDIEANIDAITEINTHLTGVTDSAVAALNGVADKLTAAETALTAIGTRSQAGVVYLNSGSPLINTATKGSSVAENYRGYAEAEAAFAAAYAREAEGRLSEATSLIQEATQRIATANILANKDDLKAQRYTDASALRVSTGIQYIASANANLQAAVNSLEIADRVKVEATEKRSEFWSVLGDRLQLRRPSVSVDSRQIKS
jgi:hypothetical protein